MGCTWVDRMAIGYSREGRLDADTGCAEPGSEVPQCFAAPLQPSTTTACSTVPVTQITSMALTTRCSNLGSIPPVFLLVGGEGGSTWPLLPRWRWCPLTCRATTWPAASVAASEAVVGAVLGSVLWLYQHFLTSSLLSYLILQMLQSHRGNSFHSKSQPGYKEHLHLHSQETGETWLISNSITSHQQNTHSQGPRALAVRHGWSWWTLGEKEKLLMHLELPKDAVLFPVGVAHASSASLSVCCSGSLLRFTFFFHDSPFCFSRCPEILLLLQFPLPPHTPLLFASLQLCLSCCGLWSALGVVVQMTLFLDMAAVFTSQVVLSILGLGISFSVTLTAWGAVQVSGQGARCSISAQQAV